MRYELEDLIQRHNPLTDAESRQLEALQRTIDAAMVDDKFTGLADAEEKLSVILSSAARKLAEAATGESILGLPEELQSWAEHGVPEGERSAFSKLLGLPVLA